MNRHTRTGMARSLTRWVQTQGYDANLQLRQQDRDASTWPPRVPGPAPDSVTAGRYVEAMSQPTTLLDEDLGVLIQVFRYFEFSREKNGTVGITAHRIPNEILTPFFRALMRQEARLLREEADQMHEGMAEVRTHAQRRADAFVALLSNIDAACRYLSADLDLPD